MESLSREKAFILSSLIFICLCAGVVFVYLSNGSLHTPSNQNNNTGGDSYVVFEPTNQPEIERIEYEDVWGEEETLNMPEGKRYRSLTKRTVVDTRTGSRIVLTYPVFSGFGDEKDNSINSIIEYQIEKQRRLNAEGYYTLVQSGARAIYELSSFSVEYADEKLLSIKFEGFYDVLSDNSHIDTGSSLFCYSVNIDLLDLDIITSKQLFSDFLLMSDRFKSGALSLKQGDADMLDTAKPHDMLSQYSIKYDIYPDIYFTDDSVNVIISLTSDLGGYAIYSDGLVNSVQYINQYLLSLSSLYSELGG